MGDVGTRRSHTMIRFEREPVRQMCQAHYCNARLVHGRAAPRVRLLCIFSVPSLVAVCAQSSALEVAWTSLNTQVLLIIFSSCLEGCVSMSLIPVEATVVKRHSLHDLKVSSVAVILASQGLTYGTAV